MVLRSCSACCILCHQRKSITFGEVKATELQMEIGGSGVPDEGGYPFSLGWFQWHVFIAVCSSFRDVPCTRNSNCLACEGKEA